MANNNWPEWLEEVSYPTPGVGDLQDLRFHMGVGESGQWIGFVQPGWFYAARLEQHHYNLVGQQQIAALPGTGQAQETISFRPSWGPVLLTASPTGQYTQHHNSFVPAQVMTWTAMGSGYYYTTVPASSIVTGVRDLTPLPLGAVSGTGSLISDKLYYYDYANSRVYTRPRTATFIEHFVDYVTLTPRLKFTEIVLQEDGILRPSYSGIEQVTITRGYQSEYQAGPITSTLTHSLTGMQDGDWARLDYYITQSYTLPDHRTVQYYTSAASGDTLTISWETSVPDLVPATTVTQPVPGLLNLNPLYSNAYRTGYLSHVSTTQPVSAYWQVAQVRALLDKEYVCAQWNELFKATILVTDIQGLPVPHYPITITMTAGASAIGRTPNAALGRTDGRGEVHFLVAVPSSISLLTINAICTAVTGTVTGNVISAATAIPSTVFIGGTTEVYVSRKFTARRYWKTYVKNVYLDGIPKNTSVIQLKSEKASSFDFKANLTNQQITLNTAQNLYNLDNIAGIEDGAEIGYLPQPGDVLLGYTNLPNHSQSRRWMTEDA